MALRKPPGWRKIVDKGGVIPLFKKVIAKMDAQGSRHHRRLQNSGGQVFGVV
jgi:hypothetical protein